MSELSDAFDRTYPRDKIQKRAQLLKLKWHVLEGMLWVAFMRGYRRGKKS